MAENEQPLLQKDSAYSCVLWKTKELKGQFVGNLLISPAEETAA